MSAHTPGPWFAEDDNGSWSIHSDHDTLGGCIAVAYSFRAEANARLIAAAPDLLAALRLIVHIADDPTAFALDGATLAVLHTARAAIAKAEVPS